MIENVLFPQKHNSAYVRIKLPCSMHFSMQWYGIGHGNVPQSRESISIYQKCILEFIK